MLFSVPQFIDVEDKIVGPLTAKQLGWLALAGVIALVFYALLDLTAFILACVPIFGIAAAMAFYKPLGQPLPDLISNMFSFTFKPKIYVWRKVVENISHKPQIEKRNSRVEMRPISKGDPSGRKISELSEVLNMTKK